MRRRTFLGLAGAGTAAGLAGCSGLVETRSVRAPPLVEDRPDAVYLPSHVEGMKLSGTTTAGDYGFAVAYSYPHRFWTVTGPEASKTAIDPDDDVHLMSVVRDRETRTVLPDTGLSVEITRDGDLVSEEIIYPMLSQPMGFHYGGNFGLDGDGTYTVRVSVGGVSVRRTGEFRDRLGGGTTAEIPVEYSEAAKNEIGFRRLDDAGQEAAVEPMDTSVPGSRAPAAGDLPGRVVGEATTGDAVFVATVLEAAPAGVDGGPYLAASARTPYNRAVLPSMALSATLARGDSTVFEGSLERTLDPALGYHYGAVVGSVEPGDELTLTVDTPPQVARHEGYETAFLDMPPTSLTVP